MFPKAALSAVCYAISLMEDDLAAAKEEMQLTGKLDGALERLRQAILKLKDEDVWTELSLTLRSYGQNWKTDLKMAMTLSEEVKRQLSLDKYRNAMLSNADKYGPRFNDDGGAEERLMRYFMRDDTPALRLTYAITYKKLEYQGLSGDDLLNEARRQTIAYIIDGYGCSHAEAEEMFYEATRK